MERAHTQSFALVLASLAIGRTDETVTVNIPVRQAFWWRLFRTMYITWECIHKTCSGVSPLVIWMLQLCQFSVRHLRARELGVISHQIW